MVRLHVRFRFVLAFAAVLAFSAFFALREATARASFDSPYTLEQTFQAALRFVRVDRAFKVTEKDPQAAYILFEYKSSETGEKISSGAIEMVPASGSVKVVVQLAGLPRYHEQVLADGLQRKLREDLGEPPRRPDPPPDAGADAPQD